MPEIDHNTNAKDYEFMSRAIQLAQRGIYTTHPNPRVGCVVVKNEKVIGEGWHIVAGEAHAEINALRQSGLESKGATLYVTLEPCTHFGRTPPCVNAILDAEISRVVIAATDPNPMVDHKGITALEEAGIKVTTGVCDDLANELNKGYNRRMKGGYPWVRLKIAASLDGKTALANGESQWITSSPARLDAHKLRASSSAIMTGIGTVLRDNPSMTARLEEVKVQPLRVICDTQLRITPDLKILDSLGNALILTSINNDLSCHPFVDKEHIDVVGVAEQKGHLNLELVLQELANRQVNEVLLEAGADLSGAMLKAGLVDELIVYMSPDCLGASSKSLFEFEPLSSLNERIVSEFSDVRMVGRDCRITLTVCNNSY